jgi:hypothetical protein
MTEFRKAKEAAVEHYATKYDDCVLRSTGKPYRFQKGSGRSEVITRFASDGITLGEITRQAATQGFDPDFTVSSLFKHHDTTDGAWIIEPPAGTTLEAIKKLRKERRVSPELKAKREALAAEKAAKQAEREAAKAAAAAEKEAQAAARAKAKEDAEAAKAAKAQAKKEAAAAKRETSEAPKKGKGKKSAPATSGEGEAEGSQAEGEVAA